MFLSGTSGFSNAKLPTGSLRRLVSYQKLSLTHTKARPCALS
jgi:hypothetical protein